MTSRTLVFLSLLSLAPLVAAQVVEPMQPAQPVHAKPAMQVRPGAALPAAAAIDREALLQAQNAKLREENAKLKAENAALKADIDSYRMLGGSQVHAFCGADGTSSRNTAGVQSDCTASGYLCEPVSGLCRTTCQNTGECAAGWVCDTEVSQCIVPHGD
jgi:hypothetical protein